MNRKDKVILTQELKLFLEVLFGFTVLVLAASTDKQVTLNLILSYLGGALQASAVVASANATGKIEKLLYEYIPIAAVSFFPYGLNLVKFNQFWNYVSKKKNKIFFSTISNFSTIPAN